jgi:hypothetical protein
MSAPPRRRPASVSRAKIAAVVAWVVAFAAAFVAGHTAGRACLAALRPPAAPAAPAAAAPPPPPPRTRRIALVHKVSQKRVTARVLAAAALAKAQVEAGGGWYRLVYSLHPGPRSSLAVPAAAAARAELAALRAALGAAAALAQARSRPPFTGCWQFNGWRRRSRRAWGLLAVGASLRAPAAG